MASLFAGIDMKKKEGGGTKDVNASEHLKGKVVGLYFSAHWCPPCKTFTPILKAFYEEVMKERSDKFEIVFMSLDNGEDEQKAYMAECHGDWCFLPVNEEKIEKISDNFSVDAIPTLVIVKENGELITRFGQENVESGLCTNVALVDNWIAQSV